MLQSVRLSLLQRRLALASPEAGADPVAVLTHVVLQDTAGPAPLRGAGHGDQDVHIAEHAGLGGACLRAVNLNLNPKLLKTSRVPLKFESV